MDNDPAKLAKLIRYFILISTTEAGSGHPTSSLSAADLMTVLFFGEHFRFDLDHPEHPNNDRLIFSKGHAAPLFYSLYPAAGKITEAELKTLRKFGSQLEGHPTMQFPYTEAATGSLGQGLSIGVGMALNAKYVDKLPYRTFVLLGDSEMAEGSVWEAIQLAAHYKLNNLVGIIDVNRLGQRGETMYGHDIAAYERRVGAFGWNTIVIDGHNLDEIAAAYKKAVSFASAKANAAAGGAAAESKDMPTMIIAKTLKGKGVPYFENKDNWHGKPLSKEELPEALKELGEVDVTVRGELAKPEQIKSAVDSSGSGISAAAPFGYPPDKPVATRKAYGNALARLAPAIPGLVVLDAETSNSTYAEFIKKNHPERFFEMYIAEQNMVGAALGLSRRGKIPFVSTFAAFFTRAFDQIRMSQYSDGNIKFVGSHAGVSIGEDGSSQMGLEDLAMFRTLHKGVVLYPSDAVSCEKLVEAAAEHHGNVYIRTTRKDTPILYGTDDSFPIGGSKVLRSAVGTGGKDSVTIVAAGVTLHEALAAYDDLQKEGIAARVIDLYSIKPIDVATLQKAAAETKAIITVEDHFPEGGLGEAVMAALAGNEAAGTGVAKVHSLAVRKMPKSGKPAELLDYEEISKNAIIKKVKEVISSR